jgi:hypothetical protein
MIKTINAPVSVEARFDEEGTVTPTAFTWQNRTYHISDVGRRWTETNGPHRLYYCLVMTPTGETFELCLDASIPQWRIVRAWERPKIV